MPRGMVILPRRFIAQGLPMAASVLTATGPER